MPIVDQGYQHWDGTLSGHAWRWLAITRRGVRTQWGKKATRRAVIGALLPSPLLAGFLVVWGLFEQQSELIAPLLALLRNLPEELRTGAKAYRLPVWTLAFDAFLGVQMFFAMILVLIVGPDLISQDLRFNAIPLYLSRPMRRIDYFAGKLGVIAVYLAAVTIAPILLAWVLGVAFSLDPAIVVETAQLLGASVLSGLVVVLSAGTLMLALSSLSKSSRMVGGMWLGVWIVGNLTATALARIVRADWCPLVSYLRNLGRVREALLETEAARESLSGVLQFAARRGRGPVADVVALAPPWQWSATILAILFGLSLCILSLRVRSLDRLR